MYNSSELISILVNGMDHISKLQDSSEINSGIEKLLQELTLSEKAELFLFDASQHRLISKADNGLTMDLDTLDGLIGSAAGAMKPVFFNHARSEKLYQDGVDNSANLRLKSQLIFPVVDEENNCALLRLSRTIRTPKNYTQNDITLLKSVELYLIKMIHLLKHDKKRVDVDETKVSESIKKLEENTSKVQQEINDTMLFLSNTVHDIRTPANSLYGFLELMEEHTSDQKMQLFIQNAKESASFINALTDTILERVKYDNEVRDAESETVNSVSFFSGIANIFSANMSSKGIHYLVKIDPAIPKEIKIEKVKLKRILINLIGNAYKFTPSEKTITLQVSYENGKIGISVRDTGLGIEEERQQEIFIAFEQAKEDTSLHYGGTGLGLAICSKYVDDLGGELKLKSKLDEGSDFYFEMPVEVVDATRAYMPYANTRKLITIYTDDAYCIDANHMKSCMEKCGMPSENIVISDKISADTTHLVCFEHKLHEGVIKAAEEHQMKLCLFEEKLFSLSKQEQYRAYPVMSKNNYYSDILYSTISSRHKPTVLIVDDNKLNVKLLESILDGEYCDISVRYNGRDGLAALEEALQQGQPYEILFSDKHMDVMSGTEMLKVYRQKEASHPSQTPLYAVSISGDTDMRDEERTLYDKVVHKPFKKDDVLAVLDRQ